MIWNNFLKNAFKYYKTIVMKTVWCWQKNRQIYHWNRIVSPEIDPHKHSLLVFGKGAMAVQWSKESLCSKWCWNHWTATQRKMDLDTNFIPFTKVSLKGIIGLSVKHRTMKLLDDNVGEEETCFYHSRFFTDWSIN